MDIFILQHVSGLYLLTLLLTLKGIIGQPTESTTVSPQKVCYDIIGCFEQSQADPDLPLPMSPRELGTYFLLHTDPHPQIQQRINASEESLRSSTFDPTKKTKLIIHGFALMQDEISSWVSRITQAILAKEDVNVIIVDWVDGASVAYDQAAQNTRVVGALTAHLMRTIMNVYPYDPNNFHVIGFSLGAHVAGFTGKELIKRNVLHKIARITGLDPANPGFNFDNPDVRLDKSDANFVDVIHTDISTLLVVASGLNRDIGHVDYYPNGGNDQPGCRTWNSGSSIVSAVTDMTVCDHTRAPKLFINSINTTEECKFTAYKCSSYAKFKEGKCLRCAGKKSNGKTRCATMGYWAEPPITKRHVKYFLQTGSAVPFCAKHYQIQIHWRKVEGSSTEGFRGSIFITLHGEKGSTEEYELNGGNSFYIVPGMTSRFLVSNDCSKDIGSIIRVTFRWKRPICWMYFFCATDNVHLKRIKVIDANSQKRSVYLPLQMDRNKDGRKDVFSVESEVPVDLLERSFIKDNYKNNFVPLFVPALAAVGNRTSRPLRQKLNEDNLNPKKNPNDFLDFDGYSLSDDPGAS